MTSRIFQSSKVLFVRENCAFLTKPSNICEFSSSVVVNNNSKDTMPIIAAVVAHRHNQKQPSALMTRQFISTKVTPPTNVVKVNRCHVQFVSNNNNNNQLHYLNNKTQYMQHQQQVASFSTSAKNLKSKLYGVFTNLSWNRLVIDHEESSRRFYAKGRDRPQSNKKMTVKINEDEMSELIDVEAYKSQLQDLTEQMKDDFAKQLSVRGSAGALETLSVEFEGAIYPLQELAQIGRKNPQLAVLNLSSLPDALQPVLKAIRESGMNLNPQQEGTTIYISLPKVTREHRENLARNAKSLFTKYKTAYQTVQNRYIKQCRSQTGVSADLTFNVQKQIMKLASDYVDEAEKLMNTKHKELLQQE